MLIRIVGGAMYISRFICVVFLFLLIGCVPLQSEETVKEESVSAFSPKEDFLRFSWIEEGYKGFFVPVNQKLGESENEIRKRLGDPESKGNYEGGSYLQYSPITYFINLDTKKSVAIALEMEKKQLTIKDLKRTLGTPDKSEFNEMDGVWMYVYKLGAYELMFEAHSEHAVLTYVWLRERIK